MPTSTLPQLTQVTSELGQWFSLYGSELIIGIVSAIIGAAASAIFDFRKKGSDMIKGFRKQSISDTTGGVSAPAVVDSPGSTIYAVAGDLHTGDTYNTARIGTEQEALNPASDILNSTQIFICGQLKDIFQRAGRTFDPQPLYRQSIPHLTNLEYRLAAVHYINIFRNAVTAFQNDTVYNNSAARNELSKLEDSVRALETVVSDDGVIATIEPFHNLEKSVIVLLSKQQII